MSIDWLRALAEQYVEQAMISAGVTSADKYYAWLRDNELGVPRSLAREVWREYRASYEWLSLLERYPEREVIPRRWYASTDSDYIEKYGYKARVTYIDPETGETREKTFLVKSGVALNRKEVDDVIRVDFPKRYPHLIREVVDYKITTIYHRRGAEW